MTEFNFTLSADDTDRLFVIKKLQGRDDLTGNEFARLLLQDTLFRMFPSRPQYDESGHLINAECYRGEL